jgi:hypothetical protein
MFCCSASANTAATTAAAAANVLLLITHCCRALKAAANSEHTVALKIQQEMRLAGLRPDKGVLLQQPYSAIMNKRLH